MFKLKVRGSVYLSNSSKSEDSETIVDAVTYRNCQGINSKKLVEAAWCNTMFPGTTKIEITRMLKSN